MKVTIVTILMDGKWFPNVKWSGIYDESWVEKLYRGFQRTSSFRFRFVCLVDREREFSEPIEQFRVSHPERAFFSLMESYRPELEIEKGFMVGLDTVIVGDCAPIVEIEGDIVLPRDPFRSLSISHSLSLFTARGADRLWRMYLDAEAHNGAAPNEWRWLQQSLREPDIWMDDSVPVGTFMSYKAQLIRWRQKEKLWRRKTRQQRLQDPWLPDNNRLIYFHGVPKQNSIREPWVSRCWK